MANQPLDDREVWSVIQSGFLQLCGHARDKWGADAYRSSEEERRLNIARWKAIEERGRELIKNATVVIKRR